MTAADAMATMAGLVLDKGERWGEIATDWQVEDAKAILLPGREGQRLHWLGRPKGGSKTTDVAGIAVTWLLTQSRGLEDGFVIASDREQASRLLRFARGLIDRSGLGDLLDVQTHAIVHRSSGARVVAMSADVSGGEGILGPLILVDELPQWADTAAARGMWDVAFSTIPKHPDMRFVVIGHAGIAGSWQHRLYERFSESPLWRVNDVGGPLPWVSDDVLEDQRATLTESQFSRRHLNVWSSADEALVTLDELRRCVTLDGPLMSRSGVQYVVGLDVGLTKDRTVAAVCHLERVGGGDLGWPGAALTERERYAALGVGPELFQRKPVEVGTARVVLDRMEVWQGSKSRPVQLGDVEDWVLEASRAFNGAQVVFDPFQAIGSAQRLEASGVRCHQFNFSQGSVGRLASTLHRLLSDGALALPPDEDLLDELSHVRLVERSPGVVRMDHASGRHDDRAIALALAAHHLLNKPAGVTSTVAYRNDALEGTR